MCIAIVNFLRRAALLLPFLFFAVAPLGHASDHGGGSGPASLKFTANLGNAGDARFLQFELVLEGATPEVGAAVSAHLPKIQHTILMMLSDENDATLRTVEGKEALMEKIRAAVNEIIDETTKTGVKEALFTNFIIQ